MVENLSKRLTIYRASLAFALLSALLVSCSKTTDRLEIVELHNGTKMALEISSTRGPGVFGERGGGYQTEIAIDFTHRGISYTWKNAQISKEDWASEPDIVDIVDGNPVIVFHVSRIDKCRAYGFPQEGMVAQRFTGGEWKRVPIANLPSDLRTNMHRSWDSVAVDGTPLAKLVPIYREHDDACAEIHPAPDAERDATLRRLISLEAESPVLEPQPAELGTAAGATSAALVTVSRRVWSKGYVSETCTGLIDKIDSFAVMGGIARAVDEVRWVTREGERLRVQLPAAFVSVFCDDDAVYVLADSFEFKSAMVYQFSRSATLRDAIKFSTIGMRASHSPGSIVALVRENDRLFILWSAAKQCEIDDPACWAYSAPWPDEADSPAPLSP